MKLKEPSHRRRVAALVPNILGFSPGQRVRIELWAESLKAAGWEIEFFPFEDDLLHEVLYGGGNSLKKVAGMIRCYEKQLRVVLSKFSADVIFIFREASLIGPAFLERLAARHKIPIVFDLDDPIFLPYKSPTNNWLSLIKFSRKTHSLFRLSTQIIAINSLIGDYAAKFNPNVTIIPNCVDTQRFVPRERTGELADSTRLVWIGSRSTMQNLVEIVEPIRKLQSKYDAPMLVIGAGESELELDQLEIRQWSAETEVADLQLGDIGLLPLNDLSWNNWKFFFKAIQYMAVGIPVVARRMGSNHEVIEDGVNGFLVDSLDEWHDRLEYLIKHPDVRRRMGEAARRTAVEKYSLDVQMPRMVEVFEQVVKPAEINVLGLCSFPIGAACTRFRMAQFTVLLRDRGIKLTISSFLDGDQFRKLYKAPGILYKVGGMLGPILNRVTELADARSYDIIFVQREALIFGPAIFEWLYQKFGRIPMVLDLDDATYIPYISPTYGRLGALFKFFGKTDRLIGRADVVVCGNRFIAEYVESRGTRAVIIPTVVDTSMFCPQTNQNEVPVIGWIGTHSTFPFLQRLFPIFERLALEKKFILKIIGGGRANIVIPGVEIENLEWNIDREIADFQSFDIGLYPLFPIESANAEWIKGKSGFKAIQYMAVGVPFVMSPVGVGAELGEAGKTHFTAETKEDWESALGALLASATLRTEMGTNGRKFSVENYSISKQADKIGQIFRELKGK